MVKIALNSRYVPTFPDPKGAGVTYDCNTEMFPSLHVLSEIIITIFFNATMNNTAFY